MIGYIYKLICSKTGQEYFGSTTDPNSRLKVHLSANNPCSSNILINPNMEILETVQGTKKDLELKEKNYILNNKCVNKNVPQRSNKELYIFKKNQNPNYFKELYIKSGGTLRNELTRVYCPCGGKYIQRNKKYHLHTTKHKNYINL